MRYTGFISSLSERSEAIIEGSKERGYEVTARLLLLTVGFVVIYERLKFSHEGGDKTIKQSSGLFGKEWENSKLIDSQFHRTIARSDWSFHQVPHTGKPTLKKLLPSIDLSSRVDRGEIFLKLFLESFRNSFAHGGIHPLSLLQCREILNDWNFRPFLNGADYSQVETLPSEQIDTVYFVSEWRIPDENSENGKGNKKVGSNIIVLPAPALNDFWCDWSNVAGVSRVVNKFALNNPVRLF